MEGSQLSFSCTQKGHVMVLFYLLSVLLLVREEISATRRPVAVTPLGKLRGHLMTSRAGRRFMAFSGIPYAKPPVGKLRFEPPQPQRPWRGIREAIEDGPYCIQSNTLKANPETVGVEDCLYLSVYSHNLHGRAPVLVHIHAGGFAVGNGARITGPQYMMDENLVVVNINYRLSMFGFLSFEDMDMPGNQGLKDQVQALRWVQQNIASFGGDPKKVTLVGESAGGVSVYHHTVSPLSRGLFHGAIAESGASYTPWAIAFPGAARNSSMWLLSLLGCNYTSTKQAVSCLREKDAKLISDQLQNMGGLQDENHGYISPTIEPHHSGAFLVGPIREWHHAPVPLLIGTTSAEGLFITLDLDKKMSYEWLNDHFEEIAPGYVQVYGLSSEPLEVVRSLRQYYLPNGQITERDYANLTRLFGDSTFSIGIVDGADEHKGDVYFYYFDYLGKYTKAGDAKTINATKMIGAYHIDESIYLWYNKEFEHLEGKDLALSKKLVKLWANFARFGTPTTHRSGFHWRKWCPQNHSYLNINKNGFKMEERFAMDRFKFWKSLKYRDNMV